jgi:hypothetical protein
MTWPRYHFLNYFWLSLVLQGCGIYSFSGSSISSEVKTFSIQNFQSNVPLGPPDLAEKFTERLEKELLQRTQLSQVTTKGEIQFEGVITQFEYKPVAPTTSIDGDDQASSTRLTITVQVSYINPKDQEFTFSKKRFSQYADTKADSNTDAAEPGLVEEIFTKLVKDIFNASVASW